MLTAAMLSAVLVVAQAAPPATNLAAKVTELVKQLDSGLAQREAAKRQLIALGPDVLDLLPADGSPNVKKELGDVRRAIEEAHALTTGQGTEITMSGQFKNLAEFLPALEKQSGNRVIDLRRPEERNEGGDLQIHFKQIRYWEALDMVLDHWELTTDPHAQLPGSATTGSLAVVKRLRSQLPRTDCAEYRGPFRLEVTDLYARRNAREPAASTLKVGLQIEWEPKIAPIAVSQSLAKIEATLDDGRLEVINPKAQLDVTIAHGSRAAAIEIPFTLPPREAKRIKTLRGTLSFLMPGRIESFRFEDFTTRKLKPLRRGSASVNLIRAARVANQWQVQLDVLYDKTAGGVQSHYGWIYDDRGSLIGPDKKQIRASRFDSDAIEGGVRATYYFDAPENLKNYAFVYETPTALFDLPIEYEFKDLPLP
ncbi:MAG: hypothetical protein WD176_08525 [Pirellulales bacterium]